MTKKRRENDETMRMHDGVDAVKALMVREMSARDEESAAGYVATVRPAMADVWLVQNDLEVKQAVHDAQGRHVGRDAEVKATGEGAVDDAPRYAENERAVMDEKVPKNDGETAAATKVKPSTDNETVEANEQPAINTDDMDDHHEIHSVREQRTERRKTRKK